MDRDLAILVFCDYSKKRVVAKIIFDILLLGQADTVQEAIEDFYITQSYRKPNKNTTEKIESKLRKFDNELIQVNFV